MIELYIAAFILGIVFNAAPGAVFAESLRRGLRGGFRAAFAVQVGSLAGDLVWAVLGLAGIGILLSITWLDLPLSLMGAALLLWLAAQSVRDAFSPAPVAEDGPPRTGSALAVGAGLSLSNPMNVTYWAAMGSTVSALGTMEPGLASFAIFLAGFMTASILWCFVCAWGIALARRHMGQRGWVVVNGLCAVALTWFAVKVAVEALMRGRAAMTNPLP